MIFRRIAGRQQPALRVDPGVGEAVAHPPETVAEVKGRSWHTPTRPRIDKHPLQEKLRWEVHA